MEELELVVLAQDLPTHGLKAGDMGTVVMVHGEGAGYEVEFTTLTGDTVAVVTLGAAQVRTIGRHEVAHARELVG